MSYSDSRSTPLVFAERDLFPHRITASYDATCTGFGTRHTFSIHFYMVPHFNITSDIPYCDPVLDYDECTKGNSVSENGVRFVEINL